ncbi:MAG: four helix bundle protein [Ignavibacteriales bacterium]|nr:four helix bundle protein [Ignavibacteriales bacterium]
MHNFKDLKIWSKSRVLVKKIYELTEEFPSDEKFGLISQMRRAAVSIVSNIAEGSGKESNKDFCRFLELAYSSAFELETQLILSVDLNFIKPDATTEILNYVQEIQKMIYSFIKTVRIKN